MGKFTRVAVMSLLALASFQASAEMKIAVLDYQMALLESDAAKKYSVDAEKQPLAVTSRSPAVRKLSSRPPSSKTSVRCARPCFST